MANFKLKTLNKIRSFETSKNKKDSNNFMVGSFFVVFKKYRIRIAKFENIRIKTKILIY